MATAGKVQSRGKMPKRERKNPKCKNISITTSPLHLQRTDLLPISSTKQRHLSVLRHSPPTISPRICLALPPPMAEDEYLICAFG
ncbi:unnamed protein product [Citrullus colocynthis]|uniref:Uncharacterized protein n=1 Tax=Citrullus colocynthis TaxID=252529 RepID=A0ABP0YWU8_9ROSI